MKNRIMKRRMKSCGTILGLIGLSLMLMACWIKYDHMWYGVIEVLLGGLVGFTGCKISSYFD